MIPRRLFSGVIAALVLSAPAIPVWAATSYVTPSGLLVSIEMTCGVGMTCPIVFAGGESIVQANGRGTCIGSEGAKPGCQVVVDSAVPSASPATVVLTPLVRERTNVVIKTSQRVYNVILTSEVSGPANGVVINASQSAPVDSGAGGFPSSAQVLAAANAADPEPLWGAWGLDYCIDGQADFRPLWVANDGRRTIVAMPGFMQAAPTVFVDRAGMRFMQVPSSNGRFLFINAIPDELEFELGEGRNRQVVHVRRGRCTTNR